VLILGVAIVILGILLYTSKVRAKSETPDAVSRAKDILEEAGIPETLEINPTQPVASLKVPVDTKLIEQIGVTVEVPTTAYVRDQLAKAALTGDISGGMSEAVFEEYFQKPQVEALGLTMTEIPTYSAVCDKVNLELGGSYVNGVLTPPRGWTGSITEWSRYIQKVGLEKYNELKG